MLSSYNYFCILSPDGYYFDAKQKQKKSLITTMLNNLVATGVSSGMEKW